MSRGKRHIPLRTCIGCHAKRDKKTLIRLTMNTDGTVVRDAFGKGGGRGAYVCHNASCMAALKMNHRLKRAFRTEGMVSLYPGCFDSETDAGSPETEKENDLQTP